MLKSFDATGIILNPTTTVDVSPVSLPTILLRPVPEWATIGENALPLFGMRGAGNKKNHE